MKKIVTLCLIISILICCCAGCQVETKTNQETSSKTTPKTAKPTESINVTYKPYNPTPTPSPTPTVAPTPTPDPAVAAAQMRKDCKVFDYKKIARTPDEYVNQWIKFSGTVVQVVEGDVGTVLRVAQDDDYDKMFYVEYFPYENTPRVLEEDTVTIYGQYMGLKTYESTIGGSITVPYVTTIIVDIKDA